MSGQWADDNERLFAVEPHLWLRRVRLEWRLTMTARSVASSGAPNCI